MKNLLIAALDTNIISIDTDALLEMSAATFTRELEALVPLVEAFGHKEHKAYNAVRWAMRKGLSAKTRKAKNLLSVSFGKGILAKDITVTNLTSERVNTLADWMEDLYGQYEGHAEAIRAMSEYDFEFHPFQRATPIEFTINNETDDGIEQDESYTFEEEDDETASWLAEQELVRDMRQSDLRKASTPSGATDNEPRFTYTNIDKYQWVEDVLDQSRDEWLTSASFGVWDAANMLMNKFRATSEWDVAYDLMKGDQKSINVPFKSLPFAVFLRRKGIDLTARVSRINNQIEYLETRINTADNDTAQSAIAAVSNAKLEDDMGELITLRAEVERTAEVIAEQAEEMYKLFDMANLDSPLSAYVSYLTFNPALFLAEKLKTVARMGGEAIGPQFIAEARTRAMALLGNPVINSFKTQDGLELWSVTYATGSSESMVIIANTISTLRYQQFKADERSHRANKVHAALRLNAMKNKKPQAMESIDSFVETFLF